MAKNMGYTPTSSSIARIWV